MRKIVFCLMTVLSPLSIAAPGLQESRFTPWLEILERPLAVTDREDRAAEALLSLAEARVAAFNLQALGRIYEELDSEFGEIRKKMKNLEDAIGEVDKWKSVGNIRKLAEARKNLAAMLTAGRWYGKGQSPRLSKIRKFLASFDWPKAGADKKHVAERLQKKLKKIHDTNFSFEKLEEGDGLHELRRALRWVLIEARVVNGMIQFKPAAECTSPEFAGILAKPIASSKYSTLPENSQETDPCLISRCLFIGAVEVVEELGKIKDRAEVRLANSGSDDVPADLRREADKIYKAMSDSRLLPDLIEEIRQCR